MEVGYSLCFLLFYRTVGAGSQVIVSGLVMSYINHVMVREVDRMRMRIEIRCEG